MKLYNLLLLFVSSFAIAQTNISVLTHKDYLNNPNKYLSKLDSSKIKTGTLVDRKISNDLIMKVNGKSKVTTIDVEQWSQIYDHLKSSSYDKSLFSSFDALTEVRDLIYNGEIKTYAIGVVDYRFNKINQSALDNRELKEVNDFLMDNSLKSSSFSEERAFAVSTLHHVISGNQVQYYIDDFFHFSNNTKQQIEKMEIDFGNGSGFQEVFSKETVSVRYGNTGGYINMVAKFTFKDIKTEKMEVLYSHFTVLRKAIRSSNSRHARINDSNLSASVPSAHVHDFFPEYSLVTKEVTEKGNTYEKQVPDETKVFIEYSIIYSSSNSAQKQLRKPFIVCDGFDPSNRRTYDGYEPKLSPDYMLEKEKDFRGLYELINGDPSPWSSETTSANLIQELTNNGYDLVIVNYIKGAGNVIENGEHFMDFLMKEINGPTFRDNKTEEAILVGPSMSGLITRYALSSIEKEGKKHYVKTWISFDSPQQGAYIPLSLQHTIKTFSHITPHFFSKLKKAKDSFESSKDVLNTDAARQLLLCHYSASEIEEEEKTLVPPPQKGKIYADPSHKVLYDKMKELPYPQFSKNYAITNGGKSKLYEEDGLPTVLFKASDSEIEVLSANGFGLSNDEMEFETNRLLTITKINFEASLPYENAPGGFHTGLYSLNYHEDNNFKPSIMLDPLTKATFISTTSAFGVPVTQESIHKTHDMYTADDTPFDEIHGMEENQEHVEISTSTRDYLLNELEKEYHLISLPMSRSNEILEQSVNGKVAYNAEVIYFGDNGNSFQIQSTADVNISAQNHIEFLPGFEIETGAKVNTVINQYKQKSSVLRTIKQYTGIDYTQDSPYKGLVYDYSDEENEPDLLLQELDATIYPNPVDNYFSIELNKNTISTPIIMSIYNTIGNQVMKKDVTLEELKHIDISEFTSGVYFINLQIENYESIQKKLIKL